MKDRNKATADCLSASSSSSVGHRERSLGPKRDYIHKVLNRREHENTQTLSPLFPFIQSTRHHTTPLLSQILN
jgi:hypothetical protein